MAVVNTRLDDSSLAQDPLPAIEAFGEALAHFHQQARVVEGRTAVDTVEAELTLSRLSNGISPDTLPTPYNRIPVEVLANRLAARPEPGQRRPVVTHGAPIVGMVTVTQRPDGQGWQAHLEPSDTEGADPAERDIAIAARSIAETFASEAVASFMIGYERAGGQLPNPELVDWYALVAALR